MARTEPTHRVAVSAYVFHGERVLLLKRVFDPVLWAPPGGRLEQDENPQEGLLREVAEETGLEIEILGVAGVWFGPLHGKQLLSIDYVADCRSMEVRISQEHSEFLWATLEGIRNGQPPVETHPIGYKISDFEKAFSVYNWLRKEE